MVIPTHLAWLRLLHSPARGAMAPVGAWTSPQPVADDIHCGDSREYQPGDVQRGDDVVGDCHFRPAPCETALRRCRCDPALAELHAKPDAQQNAHAGEDVQGAVNACMDAVPDRRDCSARSHRDADVPDEV